MARVDGVAIEKAAVDHWASVIERGGTPGGALTDPQGTPRQRAVGFLVLERWLTGEAAALGVPASSSDVARSLSEREEVNGKPEFEQQLEATGRTLADARLEAQADAAAAAIHGWLSKRAAELSEAEIRSYYEHHLQPFRHHELRKVQLIENLPSRAAAEALVNKVGTGAGFSKLAYHEEVAENTDHALGTPTKAAVMSAIFAARQGVVSHPMPLNHAWTVFIVREIVPATVRPLAEVRKEVVEKLTALRLRRFTTMLVKEYEERWRAKTSCSPGYVVRGCTQYAGPAKGEEEPFGGG